MAEANENLKHTVAFRVTEEQWQTLVALALENKTSVSQLAKARLFDGAGLDAPKPSRNPYGHKVRRA